MASTGFEVEISSDNFGSDLSVHWRLDYAEVTGAPIYVMEETGRRPSDRAGWNRMHSNRDAAGSWVRYIVGDTLPTYAPGRAGSSMP